MFPLSISRFSACGFWTTDANIVSEWKVKKCLEMLSDRGEWRKGEFSHMVSCALRQGRLIC